MYKFNTIISDNEDVEIVCLFSKNTDLPVSVWIDFKTIMNQKYPLQTLVWDNDDYIFVKFYKFLNRWSKKRLKKKDEESFKDIWPILTDELVEEMLTMLDSAIMDGWYERKTK